MVQVATSCPQKKNNEIKCTDHVYELCIRGAKATAPHFWAMPDFVTKLEYYTNLDFRDYAWLACHTCFTIHDNMG